MCCGISGYNGIKSLYCRTSTGLGGWSVRDEANKYKNLSSTALYVLLDSGGDIPSTRQRLKHIAGLLCCLTQLSKCKVSG